MTLSKDTQEELEPLPAPIPHSPLHQMVGVPIGTTLVPQTNALGAYSTFQTIHEGM